MFTALFIPLIAVIWLSCLPNNALDIFCIAHPALCNGMIVSSSLVLHIASHSWVQHINVVCWFDACFLHTDKRHKLKLVASIMKYVWCLNLKVGCKSMLSSEQFFDAQKQQAYSLFSYKKSQWFQKLQQQASLTKHEENMKTDV